MVDTDADGIGDNTMFSNDAPSQRSDGDGVGDNGMLSRMMRLRPLT